MSLIRGLKVDTQRPLDEVRVVKSIASISTLGTDNYLAYLYYKNLVVHCLEENVYYQWRVPKDEDEVGLLPSNFVYPSGIIEYGMDYSGLVFNFFLEPNLNNIAIANLGTGASIYKDFTLVVNTKTFNLKKLKSTGGTVTITELANEINFEVEVIPSTDINITAGTNVIVTEPTPNNFVISSTDNIALLENSATTTITGDGTLGNEYQVAVNNLQKVVSGFPYTLVAGDDKYTIFVDNGVANVVINVPDTLVDNFSVAFVQKGTGDVTITPTGTSVINSALGYKIKGQYYWALLEKELNTVIYYLIGNTKIIVMLAKYKKIYQTSIDIISAPCRQWIGFTYKGDATFTIEYTLCGETEPSQFIINLPGDGGADVYYDITTSPTFEEGIPCVIEGSVIKITPVLNLFTPAYGDSCPVILP